MSNPDTIVYVNGDLVAKSKAVISVYDSGFGYGDGVYEGLRVYGGRVFRLNEHLIRLFEAAKALDIDVGTDLAGLRDIVIKTLRANELRDNLHVRLMVTRGLKRVTGMNPRFNVGGASIVVLVDEKPPIFDKNGITLVTSILRRSGPDVLDAKIHNVNQLNQILASIEANRRDADEAVMLDSQGFVAETNGTTMFLVKDGILKTPLPKYIIVGITRGILMRMASEMDIPCEERDLSLYDFYNADEVFICGTVGEIVPVREIDGYAIDGDLPGPVTRRLAGQYRDLVMAEGTSIDDL